jgi:DNA repair exonuclease SbcCD nuclease subunit
MECLKIIAIGDPHFKDSNISESKELESKLIPILEKENIDLIVVLGDILDKHERIDQAPLRQATYFLSKLKEIAPLYMIIGNHDRPNNSVFLTDEHPFNSFKLWPNTYVIDNVYETTINNFNLLFLPYVSPGRFLEAMNEVEYKKSNIIFAHQEFRNAKMGAVKSITGDEWPENYPLIISGHIHDFDELQSNIIYVGTPMQHAFGDRDDKTISRILLYRNTFKHERINLGLRKRVLVHLRCEDVLKFKPDDNVLTKLKIKGTAAQIKALRKNKQYWNLKLKVDKVAFETIPEILDSNIQLNPKWGYLTHLYHRVKEDASLKYWYEQIFGMMV